MNKAKNITAQMERIEVGTKRQRSIKVDRQTDKRGGGMERQRSYCVVVHGGGKGFTPFFEAEKTFCCV